MTEPTFPAGYALEIAELATRFGVEPAELLRGTGVTMATLKDPSARLTIATCATLAERACALTGEPGLAFYMAMQARLSSHGFLGFAAMTASTIGEALELAVQFAETRTKAFALSVYVEGESASLVIEERAPLGTLRQFAILSTLLGIANLGSSLTGRPLSGTACCAFDEPEYLAMYARRFSRHFHGLLRFKQPANRLVFPSEYLALPLVSADPVAMQLARAQCEKELAQLASAAGFVGKVRESIAKQKDGVRSLDEVARDLHLSTRTLKRTLAAQGTTFSAVRDEVLAQRALLLLEDASRTITEIALRLGYSDEANFTRAFRRWTGQTPAAFRNQRHSR